VSVSFLFLSPTALGAQSVFKATFGSANQPTFDTAEGLAVDQASGDLLVIDVGTNSVSRYNADGTPAEFAALGSNVIDGKGVGDETPQNGLSFNPFPLGSPGEVQVAVDNSGGANDGNIYVTQSITHLVDIFDEDGSYLGQLTNYKEGPSAEGAEETLGEACGVGVDPVGTVYVGDFSGQIHKYEPSGEPVENADSSANLPFASNCTLAAGAGATAGFIFPAHFLGSLSELDSSSGAEEYVVDPGPTTTMTVDPTTGHVYIASGTDVREYDASGATEAELVSSFSKAGEVRGIAVREGGDEIYVARAGNANIEVWGPAPTEAITKPANPVGSESATLRGEVNPNGLPLEECFFEWGEKESYGEVASCQEPDASEVGSGNSLVSVHADIEGLKAGTNYHFRLVASNANGSDEGDDEEFLTLGPSISNESVSQITGTGARIGAQVNPRGEATSFVIQYATEAQFEESEYEEAISVPDPERELPAKSEPMQVFQQISGLSPATTYHFRIVATSNTATSEGSDQSFTTFAQLSPLPNGRAYEMVSPPHKLGEVFAPEPQSSLGGSCGECLPGENNTMMPMQSTPDGEAVAYVGQPFAEGLAAGPNEYLAERSPGGWGSQSLSEPLFGTIVGQGYQAFSADLSHGVYYQAEAALSAKAPVRGEKSFANLYLRERDGQLVPLVAEEPPNRDPGIPEAGSNQFRILYGGANTGSALTPPFSHVTFEANDSLTEEVSGIAPKAPEVLDGGEECSFAGAQCNLYEWVDGGLRLVNVLPGNNAVAEDVVIGSGRLLVNSQFEAPNVDHAISADGRSIFWNSGETGQVYARVNGEETLEIPGPGSCKESLTLAERACFLTASDDGSRILLSNGLLYELEEAGAYEQGTDLTEGLGGFRGILGASEDLSRVYFVDTEALAGTEENDNGEQAEAGKLNLYAWSEGTATFIGILLPVDNQLGAIGRYGAWKSSRPNRTAQVSPDGRFLTFMSQARLTGYDNTVSGGGGCRPNSPAACFEVFEYAAASESLSCASCNPSGQRPIGGSNLSLIAEGIPRFPPFRQPGNLSAKGDGRLFFESQDVLSSRDTNGKVADVYEWEPSGVGDCERVQGCVSLISSGHSANDSMFLDSTPSGEDVFFVTRERLLPRDDNSQLDLYDARAPHTPGEAVGFSEGQIAPCGAEACKSPPSFTQSPGGIGSSEVYGPGNPPAPKPRCKKGSVRKHGKCVKKQKAHKHRKAGSR
jgi:hypothetical protein